MPSSPSIKRRSPGQVRDAIVTVMQESGTPMSVGDIRAAVAVQLGSEVPSSSVRSYLNLNAGPGKKFKRLTRGLYRLAK